MESFLYPDLGGLSGRGIREAAVKKKKLILIA